MEMLTLHDVFTDNLFTLLWPGRYIYDYILTGMDLQGGCRGVRTPPDVLVGGCAPPRIFENYSQFICIKINDFIAFYLVFITKFEND